MTVSLAPKGATLTRLAIAKAATKNDPNGAADFARARWGEGSAPARILKTAVSAGTTENWGADLVSEYGAAVAEFMGLVNSQRILGRLSGLRRVPIHTPFLAVTGGATAGWVKEGHAMPASAMSFARDSLKPLKVAAMTIQTRELLESGDPGAEEAIRADLVRAVAEASDQAFIDPDNAGVADEQPASITYGVTPVVASADFKADLESLTRNFQGDLTRAYLIGRPELFVAISGMDFPNIGARGGEAAGIPALASRGIPMGAGDTYQLALVDPGAIAYASDPAGTQIKSTEQGAIQMDDAPTNDGVTPTGTVLVSLWQTNCMAIAALLSENWKVGRAGSVSLLTGIAAEPDS